MQRRRPTVTKRYSLLLLVFVLTGAVVFLGCGPTAMRVQGADEEEILRALWESGGRRVVPVLGSRQIKDLWPEPEEIESPRAVITWTLDGWFSATHGRDEICLSRQQPGAIEVSLKCEKKGSGLEFDLFYVRHTERERRILQTAAWRLRDRGATVEGTGSWAPARFPEIRSAHGAVWIAYRGAGADLVIRYLRSDGHKRVESTSDGRIFIREREEDPDALGGGGFDFWSDKVEWKSLEKVLVKTVPSQDFGGSPVIVVGVEAHGTERVVPRRSARSGYEIDVGQALARRTVERAALAAAVKADRLEFISPLPWTEPIDL